MALDKTTRKLHEKEHIKEEEQDVIIRAKSFWDRSGKTITYVGSAIILIIAGWFLYNNFVKQPKEAKANDAVPLIQKTFAEFANAPSDSTKAQWATVCLNGDGTNLGAIKFISKYSGTNASNLCHYYAGACYLYLKQFDNAIKQLKDFHTDETVVKSRAYGMIGDAYSEFKKNDDALDYYKKAANVNEKDEYTSSEFLFRAALFAETIGKKKEAIDLFKKIKENYPKTEKGNEVDRYLARLGEVNDL
ncbi:hypothetical protein BH09BAC2_BH09BAC2_20370 [soil metagenome]